MENIYGRILGMDVYKARVLMRNKLQRKLKPFEITVEQWNIINQINSKEGFNQKELAERSLKDRAALTRILDALEKKGFVQRESSKTDRREFLIYLTSKGKELHSEIVPLINENARENLKGFSEAEIMMLESLFKKLLLNLED